MNTKRTFGTILMIAGIVGLIYTAVMFAQGGTGNQAVRSLIIFGVLGAIFFFSGLGLIKTTRDEA